MNIREKIRSWKEELDKEAVKIRQQFSQVLEDHKGSEEWTQHFRSLESDKGFRDYWIDRFIRVLVDNPKPNEKYLALRNLWFLLRLRSAVEIEATLLTSYSSTEQSIEDALRIGELYGALRIINFVNDAIEPIKEALHGRKAAEVRKAGHIDLDKKRRALLEPWEEYVRNKIKEGYKGTAPALVQHSLKRPEFKELAQATETTYTEDGKPKNALIKKRNLEDFARETQRENLPI